MSGAVLRRAEVLGGGEGSGGLRVRLTQGPLAGETFFACAYPEFGPEPQVGEVVLVNALGVEMGLGTGGVVFLVPGRSTGEAERNRDHFVKLPYTPLQFACEPAEGAGEDPEPLRGVPTVVLPLHSHLAPACCAARELGARRVVFVCQEGGALALGFSRTVGRLKALGLLACSVSSGACFGGDIEAPNVYAALEAAARFEGGADLVVVGIGPGVVGTATRYGHGGMSVASALNAAAALGGEPVLAPRLSGADGRKRHRGVSHHTLTALQATPVGCRVAVPESGREIVARTELPARHRAVPAAGAGGLQERFGVTFTSMGRGYTEDPVFFDAAAAAVRVALGGAGGEE